ncbi:MAG: phosphoribosylformylglycinamidine synthase subunit PurL [Candidatus Omnitrophota bacterium]|nr:phosphoribosylformylglycinamidine synthase subunit PurL [Candidatus Omnitrophota bacterium]
MAGKETKTISEEVISEHGLSRDEYQRICDLLNREPRYTELGMFSAMWSEHCSYKNSKSVLKLFPTTSRVVIQGPGENAGVVDIGDNLAIVTKIESHNHPSAVEPYEASATGGGGVMRDIFTMGAVPIALADSLRFGDLNDDRVKFLFKEVARGFTTYANIVGIPVVAGEVYFDRSYQGNPLVNAMCVGLMKHSELTKAKAGEAGNVVLILGGPTGKDGVAGASFASGGLDEDSERKKSAVAIGDPKMGKILRKASLELIHSGLVVGMQDMGAAGLTCSTSEMAAKSGKGIEIDVSLVPRKEEAMNPYEIMLSESQERMLAIVKKDDILKVREICNKYNVPVDEIGRVTDDGLVRVKDKGEVVAEVSASALTENAPVYIREEKEPQYLKEVSSLDIGQLSQPEDYNDVLLKLLGSPTIASKEWLCSQSRPEEAGFHSIFKGADAGVISIKGTKKAVVITSDCNGTYCYLNPYRGGMIAVCEAARNIVCSGGRPLALTDCLNFGNPYDPEIFWQFKKCVEGISCACKGLDIPVISGNVSFHNESPKGSVDPTPVIGMVGLLENVDRFVSSSFKKEGDIILLIGETFEELGGTEFLKIIHNMKKGRPPELNLDREKRNQGFIQELVKRCLINSAHDLSEGGLAAALAESCIVDKDKMIGAKITCEIKAVSNIAFLFGESQSRVVVSSNPRVLSEIETLAKEKEVPLYNIGCVGGDKLIVNDLFDVEIKKLTKTWRNVISGEGK